MEGNMNGQPLVTIVMPVYNAALYLRQAIDSMLAQTYPHFELLILNDGSSDGSDAIIRSYQDPRIRYVVNEKNIGVIATLNKAIGLAKGEFIERMDADDVSMPERLAVQLDYFRRFPQTVLVCSPVALIGPNGRDLGVWEADRAAMRSEQIRERLPFENCIAQPTVLMRTQTLREYMYNPAQQTAEDWDLWLRLLADGHQMVKTKEVLLKYRLHPESLTHGFNLREVAEQKVLKIKRRFLWEQWRQGKFSKTSWVMLYSIFRTQMRHWKLNVTPQLMRSAKRLFSMSPFKAWRHYRDLKQGLANHSSRYFLFFPYSHTGGAERVHADITQAISDVRPFVFFTGIHNLNNRLDMFKGAACPINVGHAVNHPFFAGRSRRLILNRILQTEGVRLFGCNNLFFYDLIPGLPKHIEVSDLSHDFRFEGEQDITISYFPRFMRCRWRVFVSQRAVDQTRLFYDAKDASAVAYERLRLIVNYVPIPDNLPEKPLTGPLQVYYIGRDTYEKRVHLVVQLARLCEAAGLPVHFSMVGPMSKANTDTTLSNITYVGEITEKEHLNRHLEKAQVVLITSEREGFPMSIMEGMAYGAVPVSTPVGDVPYHLRQGANGYYTSTIEEELALQEFQEILRTLAKDPALLQTLSKAAREYAQQHFTQQRFVREYREVLGLS